MSAQDTVPAGRFYAAPSREAFAKLLYAAYNIAPHVEPGDDDGVDATDAALEAMHAVYDLLEAGTRGRVDGILTVVRLLAETTCAADPQAYAASEAERGYSGDRVEENDATLRLPRSGS